MHMRTPQYYAILPSLQYIMANAKVGLYFEPPNIGDAYVNVASDVRGTYLPQSAKLYEELERKLRKDVLENIRKEFKFGMEEKKVSCSVGDGVTSVFCLLAMYRPIGMIYRESIKHKMAAKVGKFSDGSCPANQVKEVIAIL